MSHADHKQQAQSAKQERLDVSLPGATVPPSALCSFSMATDGCNARPTHKAHNYQPCQSDAHNHGGTAENRHYALLIVERRNEFAKPDPFTHRSRTA
jgi:hypothetical protein